MKSIISIVILSLLITSCSNPPPKVATVCHEATQDLTHEERQQHADACFKRGSFTKSKPMEW